MLVRRISLTGRVSLFGDHFLNSHDFNPLNPSTVINVNLLPKYSCIIQQTDNENTQTYQVEATILI